MSHFSKYPIPYRPLAGPGTYLYKDNLGWVYSWPAVTPEGRERKVLAYADDEGSFVSFLKFPPTRYDYTRLASPRVVLPVGQRWTNGQ